MGRGWIGLALAALLAAGGCVEANPGLADQRARTADAARQGGDVTIAQYHEAARAGAVGTVQGRAYAERRKPTAEDLPLEGTVLMLLPRSDTFLAALDTIRQGARDSLDRYRESAAAMRRVREAYEAALLERGGGDLARTLTVNADGSFAVSELPAGEWVLVATHTVFGKKATGPSPKGAAKDAASGTADRFLPSPRLLGHSYITLWLRELTVSPGAAATVALTDRNIWFTGVLEDTETPVFRAAPPINAPSMPGGPAGGGPVGGPGTGGSSPSPQR